MTRDGTFAKDFEGVTYTYRLRAKSAAKELLVTVPSRPLIPDGELALYFRRFVVVKKVVGQSYAFNHQIDNCLRCIILLCVYMYVFSVPIPRHKSRFSHVNVFLRHYGEQLKTANSSQGGSGRENGLEKIIKKRKRNKSLKFPSFCAVFNCSNCVDREKDKSNYRFP